MKFLLESDNRRFINLDYHNLEIIDKDGYEIEIDYTYDCLEEKVIDFLRDIVIEDKNISEDESYDYVQTNWNELVDEYDEKINDWFEIDAQAAAQGDYDYQRGQFAGYHDR